MKNSNYFDLDGRYFRANMKNFDNPLASTRIYYQIVRTEDGSVYAKIVGSNELMPIYYRDNDGILKGYLMHEEYSRNYVDSPFEIIVSDNGLFTDNKFAPYYQANRDVIDFIELSYRKSSQSKKKTYGLR